ncbi:MAG: amidohydrolase family protein [Candidatus Kapabacteria bacterium]|jgi:imidazolonepropionase-like amidohydrolase|nr:amidohydrolase family protein [Candidatus Kapabacteria bacterium]
MKHLLILIISIVICVAPASAESIKAFSGATLLKTNEPGVIKNCIVLTKDDKIIAVSPTIKIPEGTDVIDLAGKYIIPGMIDGHIHFFQSGGLYARPDGLDLRHRKPYLDELKETRTNIDDMFRRYIRSGVTTVADMGGPMWNFDVRDQSLTAEAAPRVFITGPLIASYQPDALTTDDPPIVKVTSISEALKMVRKQAGKKADFIKIWYVVSKKTSAGLEEFFPIAKAICDESHKLGLKVYVHATELATAKKAIKAGADVLAHIVVDKEVDDEFLKLCKTNNIIIMPTLRVFNSYSEVYSKQLKLSATEHLYGNPYTIGSFFDMYELKDEELGERQRKLPREDKPIAPSKIILNNLKKIFDYGITIANGTDAGNVGCLHGPAIFRDYEIMSMAGLTNPEILKIATLNSAEMLGIKDRIGSVEIGKKADFVVLNSNPYDDIQNTSDIFFTVKDGKIYRPEEILKVTPEDLAQVQLNAYNAHDIEAFLAVYSDDVEVYNFPNELVYTGKDKMRKLYTPYFKEAVGLHCELVNRITCGKYVTDRERVTGNPRMDVINAVAIYEVDEGLINKIWFIKE